MPATPPDGLVGTAGRRQAASSDPGLPQLTRIGANAFTATVVLGVGPVAASFDAKVGLSDLDEPRVGRLSGAISPVRLAQRRAKALDVDSARKAAVASTIVTTFIFRAASR